MKLVLILAAALLAGCATTANLGGPVKPAEAEQVKGCAYLNDVHGSSMWYGMFASAGLDSARTDVLKRAQELGATHLVWSQPDSHFGGTTASGKAYRCGL